MDDIENCAIDVWDSVYTGFNTLPHAEDTPTSCLYGESNGSSKYTNEQIEQAFLLLVNEPDFSHKKVSEITKVPKLKPVVSQMKDELQLANLKVPEIEFTAFKLEILLPEPTLNHEEKPEPIPKKTLHEVTISWGIESSKPKIGTSFGRQDRYLNQTFQTDKKSIRIRFGQDN